MPLLDRLLRVLLLAAAMAFAPFGAFAQSADEAFTRLNADSFSDTARAVDILIATAHPQSAPII